MKKFVSIALVMAVPASATPVVTSPFVLQNPAVTANLAGGRQWTPTALANGGYARCKNPNGCRSPYAPYGQIVAGYGEVDQGVVLDGVTNQDGGPGVPILVIFPYGSANLPYSGIYSRADDWEGVA